MSTSPTILQIFLAALRLGCTSFGGPVAHLAYFRRDYVEQRRWLTERDYADLVALCQFLPGPASSQTGFGIGYLQRGWRGGLAAWAGFTLPSAVLMIAFALGLGRFGAFVGSGWLHGLKLAAVAVVAQAVLAMWRSLAWDAARSALVLAGAGALLALPYAWMQVAVIAAGALAGRLLFAGGDTGNPGSASASPPFPRASPILLGVVLLLLVALPASVRMMNNAWLAQADTFYRAGALVFGGGHVVLPLLERELVVPGGVTPDQFLAGYGAAQAVPGPLFTFAAYLGAAQHGVRCGLWTLVWIFLPGLLLVPAALPVWQRLREDASAQAAMRGANAAVVGVLLAALITPVGQAALTDGRSAAVAAAAFAALQLARLPSWAAVLACAAAGALFA
ncbi:MAG: chromate transporter [Opitutus sp.]|nr:chromate transporter [Opitutus sp.]